jgi:hypothetical protein
LNHCSHCIESSLDPPQPPCDARSAEITSIWLPEAPYCHGGACGLTCVCYSVKFFFGKVDSGASVPLLSFWQTKKLNTAAATNDIRGARLEIELGANVNGDHLVCPLVTAASHGHLAIARLLLQKGARIGGRGGSQNPLRAAAANGHLDMVDYLYEQGADLNGCAHHPLGNPLTAAFESKNEKIPPFLVQHGACWSQYINARADARLKDALPDSYLYCSGMDSMTRCGERPTDILDEGNDRLPGYRRLRQIFLEDYSVFLSRHKAHSASHELKALGCKLRNHRETWKAGIATIRQLLDGSPPQKVDQIVGFLLVVSAMRSFLNFEDDELGSRDEFCDDLDRWRAILGNDQLPLYDEVVLKIWGKGSNGHIAGHLSSSVIDHLTYFQNLVTSLIGHSATPSLERDLLFTGERLRTIQSKHRHQKHTGGNLTQAKGAESTDPGISVLPTQECHRYKEIHSEIPGMAQNAPPAPAFVVFLMAGAIFGIVITFLTCKMTSSAEGCHADDSSSVLCFDPRLHISTRTTDYCLS